MIDRSFLCADCGAAGAFVEVQFLDPPDGDFHAEDKHAEVILKKNGMKYIGCPSCRSANVFFSGSQRMAAFIPSRGISLGAGEAIIGPNVPACSIPQFLPPKGKLKDRVVSSTPAIGGGRNVTMVTEFEPEAGDAEVGGLVGGPSPGMDEPVDDVDDILLENAKAADAPVEPVAAKLAQAVGGKLLPRQSQRIPQGNDEGRKVDMSKVDSSKTGIGKVRQHVPRRSYRRECKGCGNTFETKHDATFYCRKCLRRYAS